MRRAIDLTAFALHTLDTFSVGDARGRRRWPVFGCLPPKGRHVPRGLLKRLTSPKQPPSVSTLIGGVVSETLDTISHSETLPCHWFQ